MHKSSHAIAYSHLQLSIHVNREPLSSGPGYTSIKQTLHCTIEFMFKTKFMFCTAVYGVYHNYDLDTCKHVSQSQNTSSRPLCCGNSGVYLPPRSEAVVISSASVSVSVCLFVSALTFEWFHFSSPNFQRIFI